MGNIALWMQVHQLPEVSGLRGFAFAMGFGAIITATLTLILSLLNWRWLLKPVLTVFFFQRCKRRLLHDELRHRDRQQHDHQRDPN
jgi:glucan phosphoethanolaminetransferase (alkaline phosphatase superfamily)